MLKEVAELHIAKTVKRADALYENLKALDGGGMLVDMPDATYVSRQDDASVLALNPCYYSLNQLDERDPGYYNLNMGVDQHVYAGLLCQLAACMDARFQASALEALKSVPGLDPAGSSIHAAPVKLPARCAEKVLEYIEEGRPFPR
jgi:hypothetical protein